MAVGVVLVVVGVLVVGEQVLRDPDEDVEADWVGCNAKERKARERESQKDEDWRREEGFEEREAFGVLCAYR